MYLGVSLMPSPLLAGQETNLGVNRHCNTISY